MIDRLFKRKCMRKKTKKITRMVYALLSSKLGYILGLKAYVLID